MFKRLGIALLLLFLMFSCGYPYVSGEDKLQEVNGGAKKDRAWVDMLNGFEIYLNFFNDSYPWGNFTVSRHADTYEEALSYFCQGFDARLAEDIITAYTFYDADHKQLLILPTDGLPVLLPENPNLIRSCFIDEDQVVFERYFEDYYGEDSRYLYRVFCTYQEERWKISRLEWERVE